MFAFVRLMLHFIDLFKKTLYTSIQKKFPCLCFRHPLLACGDPDRSGVYVQCSCSDAAVPDLSHYTIQHTRPLRPSSYFLLGLNVFFIWWNRKNGSIADNHVYLILCPFLPFDWPFFLHRNPSLRIIISHELLILTGSNGLYCIIHMTTKN